MTYTIKNITVVLTVVVSLAGINKMTENNYMDLHNGVRPVIKYSESNTSVNIANLMVRPNTF